MSPGKTRLLVILTLLVVFVAGSLVGAVVERERHGERGPRRGPGRGGAPPPMFAEGSPLAQRLKLTEVQRDSIEKLTARDRAVADSVFRETRRGMRTRFDSTMRAVEAVLTPAQRAEWQKVRQEWENERREGRGRRGPRGDGRRGEGRRGPDGPGMPPGAPPGPESAGRQP